MTYKAQSWERQFIENNGGGDGYLANPSPHILQIGDEFDAYDAMRVPSPSRGALSIDRSRPEQFGGAAYRREVTIHQDGRDEDRHSSDRAVTNYDLFS